MSLGSNYSNNGKEKKFYDPSMYSAYRMNNATSNVDQTCITFQYWKNTLRIGIYPKKNTGNDEVAFDMDSGIAIYMSHTKARIFSDILKKFKENPTEYNNSGVDSGEAVITINDGSAHGSDMPILAIKRVDGNGTVVSEYAYQFKNTAYAIKNYNSQDGSFNKMTDDYRLLELDQLITLLDNYYVAMTGAYAFSVLDASKYENNRLNSHINQIAEKLGVEFKTGSGNGARNTSYFASNSGTPTGASYAPTQGYTPASLDDID